MHFSLTDLVTDIVQNGVESGTDLLELFISDKKDFRFTVKDRGKWMTKEELERSQDPFVSDGIKHPQRRVGLGIPFLIQTAETSGGGWKIESKKGPGPKGTEVSAWFDLDNVDTPPIGDIPGMLRTVLLFEGPSEILIKRQGRVNYEVRKTELVNALGGLRNARSLVLMDEFLKNREKRISNR